jgi:fumarate reductase subunit C
MPGTRAYTRRMPANWWTRRRNYFLYVVREFTSLPLALWLLWFLYDVVRARPGHYYASGSIAFVVFSVIVLLFALYHSITFLSLAGSILRFKVVDKTVPAGMVVLAQFAIWAVASAVVAAVLIGFAR